MIAKMENGGGLIEAKPKYADISNRNLTPFICDTCGNYPARTADACTFCKGQTMKERGITNLPVEELSRAQAEAQRRLEAVNA